ncbi:MAG: HigA family addiction module antidote protein [Anaerolineales bacterium]|nr:HigA family addiction module antidote protein [Anaerolineales bacterium]
MIFTINLSFSIKFPNEIINGRRGVTPSTALRLAKFFGMSAGFWMNLQLRWDLYQTQQAEAQELETIEPYPVASNSSVAG